MSDIHESVHTRGGSDQVDGSSFLLGPSPLPPVESLLTERCPDDLQCQICMETAHDPIVTDRCGHLFCKDCIVRSLREVGPQCPVDRYPLEDKDLRPDVRSKRRILELRCVCCNSEQGGQGDGECEWAGSVGDLASHLKVCGHGSVGCPFAIHGCPATSIAKKDLATHLETSANAHLMFMCESLCKLQECHSHLQDDHTALQQEVEISHRRGQSDVVSFLSHQTLPLAAHNGPRMSHVDELRCAARSPSLTSRFVWVIPQFNSAHNRPLYSRKFFAKGYQWYLGADFDDAGDHAGVYLYAEGHTKRINFRLLQFHVDPSKDQVHVVNDWAPSFKGKGWGPLKFINRRTIATTGFLVKGCLRVGVEMDAEAYD